MTAFDFESPGTLREVLELLNSREDARVIAGGTDLLVDMAEGRAETGLMINIAQLKDLRFIRSRGDNISIGPLTTFADLEQSTLIKEKARALFDAAWTMGSPQIRNSATLGGNLGKASVAADGLTALTVLDTKIVLTGLEGSRTVALEDMLQNKKGSAMTRGELITEIFFNSPAGGCETAFYKLARRKALGIVDIGGAVSITRDSSGLCSSVILRGGALARFPLAFCEAEEFLKGKHPSQENLEKVYEMLSSAVCESLKDRPWEVEYKKHAVRGVFRKIFTNFTQQWNRESAA